MKNSLYENLHEKLVASTADLMKHYQFNSLRYGFIDNNANVLAVVHLDTVARPSSLAPSYEVTSSGDVKIKSINLDDRLGLWLLLDYIPQMYPEIKYDVLLTTDEEIGQSTASGFVTDKKYNWMFQFDRKFYGTVVMYQYETAALTTLLMQYDYDVQVGTFSDISALDHLGCSGFNFGCGYVDEHTDHCTTRQSWINVVTSMFADFYRGEKDSVLTYVPQSNYYSRSFRSYGYVAAPKYKTSALPSRTCASCGRNLLAYEDDICDWCVQYAGSEEPMGICSLCDGTFVVSDLQDDMCADCIDYINRKVKGQP